MTSDSCEAIQELLIDYSDGELPEGNARRVAAHVAECSECRSELHRLGHSLELARSVWEESAARPPTGGAIPVERRSRPMPAAAVLVGGAAIVVIAVGTWMLLSGGAPPEVNRVEPVELAGPVEPVEKIDTPKKAEEPAAAPHSEEIDVDELIARAGRAARLAAAAEILATQPGLEQYGEQTERYLAKTYRGTPAGDRAARRIDSPFEKEPES